MKLSILFLSLIFSSIIYAQKSGPSVAIPDYAFSEKIAAGPFTVSADTRTNDPKSGKLTGTVNLSFHLDKIADATLDIEMNAVYSNATKAWTFTKSAAVKSDTNLPGISVSGQKLVKVNGKWTLSGNVGLKELQAASGNLGLIPSSGLLTIEDGVITITYGDGKKDLTATIDNAMSVSMSKTMTLTHENKKWLPSIETSLTVFGTRLNGTLSYKNNLLQFSMDEEDHPSATIPAVGKIDFKTLFLTLGAKNTISGTALLEPVAPAGEILPTKGFNVSLSGTPGNITLASTKAADIPKLSLGDIGELSFWPVDVTRVQKTAGSSKAVEYVWDIGSSLTILGKKISGSVAFEKDLIKIKDVILADGFPPIDLTLKKLNGSWSMGINDNLSPAEVAKICAKIGLSAVKNTSVKLDGLFTKTAFRMTLDKGLQMPPNVPSWMKINSTSIKDISLTHSFSSGKSVADFKVDIDLSNVPGLSKAGVKTLSVIAGDGVAVNSFSSPTAVQPWFISAWKEMGSSAVADFHWYTPSTTSSEKGIALGFADSKAPLKIDGLSGADIDSLSVSYAKQNWDMRGSLDYAVSFPNPQLNSILGTNLDLIFSYDGTTFSATENLVVNGVAKVRDLIPEAGLKLEMSKVNLTHTGGDWSLSVDSALDWLSKKISGKVVIPQKGTPSFTPTPVTGGWTINFPGSINPKFESIEIMLGENYGCNGKAKLQVDSASPLHNVFPATTTLDFSAHKGKGWSLAVSNPQKTAIAKINIGKDCLELKSLAISRATSSGPPDVSGNASYVFGSGSQADCTFSVTPEETSVLIPEFSIIKGLALKAELDIKVKGNTKVYSGSIGGSLTQENVKALYGAFDLTAASVANGKATATGTFSGGDCSVTFTNLPPIKGLTSGNGIEFGEMKSLSLSRTGGVNKLEIDMYMGLGKLAPLNAQKSGGVEAIVKVEKSSTNTSLDIDLKSHVDLDVKFGTLSLTELDISYLSDRKNKWSIDGKGTLNKLSSTVSSLMNTLELGQSFDLDLGYEAGNFIVDVNFEKSKVLNLIPNRCEVNLSGLKLSAGESGMSLGCVSKISAAGKTVPGLAVFDMKNASVDFQPEGQASFDLGWVIKDIGSFDVKGLTFSVGSVISISSKSVVFTSADPKALIWQAMGSSTLSGSFFGTPDSLKVRMNLPGKKLQSTIKVKPLPDLVLELDKVTISTEGEFSGSGSAVIGDFSADITLGASPKGPSFKFTPHGKKKLQQIVKSASGAYEFILTCGSTFTLATNALSIPTLTFESVDMRVENPKTPEKPYMKVSTDNFVFYLPGTAGTGFVFFDKFEGLIDVAGLDCNTEIKFPDPLSKGNVKAVEQGIFDLLSGKKSFTQALEGLKAPSLSIQNTYIHLPENLFGKEAKLDMKDKEYNVSALGKMIHVPDLKQIGQTLLEEMLHDIDGDHKTTVLGVELDSKISYKKGFRCDLDMNATFLKTVKIDTKLSGNFERDTFSLYADGKSQVKSGKSWTTMTDAKILLSNKEFSISGKILGIDGKNTINSKGYSFVGHAKGKTLKGKFTVSSRKMELDASLYIAKKKVGTNKYTLKDGKVKISVSKNGIKGKNYDLDVRGSVTFDIAKDKVSLSAKVKGTVGGHKNDVSLKLDGHTIKATLIYYAPLKKYYHFEYDITKAL